MTAERHEPVIENGAARAGSTTLLAMIDKAVGAGNLDLVDRMMTLQERWEKNEAKKAFVKALAAAKAKIKPIVKNRRVQFENRRNDGKTDYFHEDIAAIADVVDPILGEFGLFYNWKVTNADGKVTVTCVLSHEFGHSEDANTLIAPVDCSGSKNGIQGIASATTYLERYTLKAALGLAVQGDDDGRAAADPTAKTGPAHQPQGPLTPEQVEDLQLRIVRAGLPIAAFYTWAKVERIEDIPASRFERCVQAVTAWSERTRK